MSRFGIAPGFLRGILVAFCLSLLSAALLKTGLLTAAILHCVVILAALIDFFRTPGAKCFSAQRIHNRNFEQNQSGTVELRIKALKSPYTLDFKLCDTAPESFVGTQETVSLSVKGGETVSHEYIVAPRRRGQFSFGKCYLEVKGRWGLSVKGFSLDCPGDAPVYPNLEPMRHYRMLAQKNQLHKEDSSLHKIRGMGTEFVGIREYAPDDDWRKVNWKATARAGKLMTNVYDVEKNRDVILALDTGRWMQAETEGVTRLDRSLEMAAALMQVALAAGDRVGLILFDTKASVYLPPKKGSAQAARILNALYEARLSSGATSYSALTGVLSQKLSKRAFVCIFTYIDSPHEAKAALTELGPLRRRHSLYVASLSDEGLDSLIEKEAALPGDVYLKAAAVQRKRSLLGGIEVFARNGVGAHAAEPKELLTRSVRHYLYAKRMSR